MSLQLSSDGKYVIDLTTGIVTPLFPNLPFGNIIQDPATQSIPLLSATNNPHLTPLTFPPPPPPILPPFDTANGINHVPPLYAPSALSSAVPPALTPLDHILDDAFAQAAQAAWSGLQRWTKLWRTFTNVTQSCHCQMHLDPPPYDPAKDPEFYGEIFLLREQTKAIISTANDLSSPHPNSTHPFISSFSSSHDQFRPANHDITGQSRKRAQPLRSKRTVNHLSQQAGAADIQIEDNCTDSEQSELDEEEDIAPVLSPQTCCNFTGSSSSTIEKINAETASISAAAARINLRPVQVQTMMTLKDTLLERISNSTRNPQEGSNRPESGWPDKGDWIFSNGYTYLITDIRHDKEEVWERVERVRCVDCETSAHVHRGTLLVVPNVAHTCRRNYDATRDKLFEEAYKERITMSRKDTLQEIRNEACEDNTSHNSLLLLKGRGRVVPLKEISRPLENDGMPRGHTPKKSRLH